MLAVKTLLVIAYMMGGQVIDTDVIENASMEECQMTKKEALAGKTPITTSHGLDVKISAECKPQLASAGLNNRPL